MRIFARAFGVGPESNSALMYVITPLVYEALKPSVGLLMK